MIVDLTLTERPKDLSTLIDQWLHTSIELATALNVSQITDDLQKIDEHQKYPGYRLAVVGDIASGKSTFINRLLVPPCRLPTGSVPTTATITLISAGPSEQMMVYLASGRKELRQLVETSWEDLKIGINGQLNPGGPPQVQLTLHNKWLQDLDIEVIDTPGIDGLTGSRALLISKLLSQCDAVVMLVNSFYPFSLTNALFLEQAIIGQSIPHVLVVVSKLDMLLKQGSSQSELRQQFKLIQKRVAKVAPHISVVASHPLTEGESETEVIADLRFQIEAMVARVDRKAWRSQQIASLIVAHLDQLAKIGQMTHDARRMDITKKEEARRKLNDEIQKSMLGWENISSEFAKRRKKVEQGLRERIFNDQNKLIGKASRALLKASDPKLWWEKDLPFLTQQAFLSLARQSESFLLDSLASDIKWLEEEIGHLYDTKLETIQPVMDFPIEIQLNRSELRLQDFKRLNLFMKLGYGASAILAEIFLSHLGMSVGNAEDIFKLGGIVVRDKTVDAVNDSLLHEKIEEQRQRVEHAMRQSIIQNVENYIDRISNRLVGLYDHVAQDMQRQQMLWKNAKYASLEQSEIADEEAYQRLIDEAVSLKSRIIGTLYTK